MNIYSYNKHSESAKVLGEELNIKRIKHEGSRFRGSPKKVVINWGSTEVPEEVSKCTILNRPEIISKCSNKLEFFNEVSKDKRIHLPPFTTDKKEAFDWIANKKLVCARTVLNGHSAKGLVIMTDDPQTHVDAPLYVQYIPKVDEYRIHVFRKQVVDLQRKALRSDWHTKYEGEPNWRVRNHDNGFVYVKEGVNPPETVIGQSLLTIESLGLDFGAVDVIWNHKKQMAYVLEVNSAPGLEGSTIRNYADAFKNML